MGNEAYECRRTEGATVLWTTRVTKMPQSFSRDAAPVNLDSDDLPREIQSIWFEFAVLRKANN